MSSRKSRPGIAGRDAFAVGTIVALGVAILGFVAGQPVFVSLATIAGIIVLWPILTGMTPLLSPWGVVALNVLLSVFVRGLFIGLRYPNDEIIQTLFLLGETDDFFFWPSVLLVTAIGIAALAYTRGSNTRRLRTSRFLDAPWDSRRVGPLVLLLAVASALAFLAFVQVTGGFAGILSSSKRTTIPGLELSPSYDGFGYLRSVAALGRIALLLLSTHWFLQTGPIRIRQWIALGSLLLLAQALPLYASSRVGALWILIELLVIWYAAGRRLDMKRVLTVALIAASVFQIMTVARSLGESATAEQLLSFSVPGESVVLTRNMLGISKTAHVVNAVGTELQPKNGATIVTWLAAPIPRRIWPSKPITQPGPEVGVKVFGTTRAGVPPGLIGDLYWNFGIGGVLVGSSLLFFFIGRWFAALAPFTTRSPSRIVAYVAILFTPTWALLSNGVGAAAYTAAFDGALLFVLLWLLHKRTESRALPSPSTAFAREAS